MPAVPPEVEATMKTFGVQTKLHPVLRAVVAMFSGRW